MLLIKEMCQRSFFSNPTPDDSLGFKWEPSTADNLHYLSLTPSPSMQPDNREEVGRLHFLFFPKFLNLILTMYSVFDNFVLHNEQHKFCSIQQKTQSCHVLAGNILSYFLEQVFWFSDLISHRVFSSRSGTEVLQLPSDDSKLDPSPSPGGRPHRWHEWRRAHF